LAQKYFESRLKIYHGSVTNIPFDDMLYNGIFCYGLIYLLDKDERAKLIQNYFNQLNKDTETYGKGRQLNKDRFEMFGGVNTH